MAQYHVFPIADESCDSLQTEVLILATDDIGAARHAAAHAPYPFGAGILDRESGQIDVGYGFGVPCPDLTE